jgi:hypothetical protein
MYFLIIPMSEQEWDSLSVSLSSSLSISVVSHVLSILSILSFDYFLIFLVRSVLLYPYDFIFSKKKFCFRSFKSSELWSLDHRRMDSLGM